MNDLILLAAKTAETAETGGRSSQIGRAHV